MEPGAGSGSSGGGGGVVEVAIMSELGSGVGASGSAVVGGFRLPARGSSTTSHTRSPSEILFFAEGS